MKKTIFLHIGIHKTGTTTIQSFLSKNGNSLLQEGVFYPREQWIHHRLVSSDSEGLACISERNESYWRSLKKNIEGSGATSAVLSSEGFSKGYAGTRPEYIESVCEHLKEYDPRIIVYLRRQDSFFESMYTQVIKTGNRQGFSSLNDMLDRIDLDYEKMLAKWSAVFGKENMYVRVFERDEGCDVVANFLEALGLEDTSKFEMLSRTHMKPGIHHLRALTYVRESLRDSPEIGVAKQILTPFVRATRHWPRDREYRLIPYETARSILDKYRESNNTVAEEYLGGRESLFSDDLEEYVRIPANLNTDSGAT